MRFTIPENAVILTVLGCFLGTAAGATDSLVESVRNMKDFDRKVWGQAVQELIAKENEPLLTALLDTRVRSGNPAAERRFKLFEIYRSRPSFFVAVADRHWGGNVDCVVDLLVPASGVLSPWEIETVASKEEVRGKATPALRAFHKRVTAYAAQMKAGRPALKLDGCDKALAGKPKK